MRASSDTDASLSGSDPDFRASQAAQYVAGGQAADDEVAGRHRTYARKAALALEAWRDAPDWRADDVAVEIGCGGGVLTRLIASAEPTRRWLGTDFSPVMLDVARRACAALPRVEFRVHDAYEPFPQAGEFAFGFGCDILHHLDDPVRALGHLRHALRPGGSMLFLESNPRNPVIHLRCRNRPEEQRVYLTSERTLAEWAAAAGFADVAVRLLPFHLPNGPPPLAGCLNFLEEQVLHRLPPLRHRAAMFALTGTAK